MAPNAGLCAGPPADRPSVVSPAPDGRADGSLTGSWQLADVYEEKENMGYEIVQTAPRYKVYGQQHVLYISRPDRNAGLCRVELHTYHANGRNGIKESGVGYNYEIQGDKLLLAFNDLAPHGTTGSDIRKETWQRTEIPADIDEAIRVITTEKTGTNRFHGVWRYKGQYAGKVRENAPDAYVNEAYGNLFYKIYGDSTYRYLRILASNEEKGQYDFVGLWRESCEYISDESLIERGQFEVDIKWIDPDNYYLTYFNPVSTIYITEIWTRSEIPQEIIQTLKECGF